MSKGIFIDAAHRTVSLFDYTDREGTDAQLHRLDRFLMTSTDW
jgi:hypothetical protein